VIEYPMPVHDVMYVNAAFYIAIYTVTASDVSAWNWFHNTKHWLENSTDTLLWLHH